MSKDYVIQLSIKDLSFHVTIEDTSVEKAIPQAIASVVEKIEVKTVREKKVKS